MDLGRCWFSIPIPYWWDGMNHMSFEHEKHRLYGPKVHGWHMLLMREKTYLKPLCSIDFIILLLTCPFHLLAKSKTWRFPKKNPRFHTFYNHFISFYNRMFHEPSSCWGPPGIPSHLQRQVARAAAAHPSSRCWKRRPRLPRSATPGPTAARNGREPGAKPRSSMESMAIASW